MATPCVQLSPQVKFHSNGLLLLFMSAKDSIYKRFTLGQEGSAS